MFNKNYNNQMISKKIKIRNNNYNNNYKLQKEEYVNAIQETY